MKRSSIIFFVQKQPETSKAYYGPHETSLMELIYENILQLLAVNYFCKAPS